MPYIYVYNFFSVLPQKLSTWGSINMFLQLGQFTIWFWHRLLLFNPTSAASLLNKILSFMPWVPGLTLLMLLQLPQNSSLLSASEVLSKLLLFFPKLEHHSPGTNPPGGLFIRLSSILSSTGSSSRKGLAKAAMLSSICSKCVMVRYCGSQSVEDPQTMYLRWLLIMVCWRSGCELQRTVWKYDSRGLIILLWYIINFLGKLSQALTQYSMKSLVRITHGEPVCG